MPVNPDTHILKWKSISGERQKVGTYWLWERESALCYSAQGTAKYDAETLTCCIQPSAQDGE